MNTFLSTCPSNYHPAIIFLQGPYFSQPPFVRVCVCSISLCPPEFLNVDATGKGRPGPEAGHWRHGGSGSQVRGLCLLHHARGDGTLAVLHGAWCQVFPPRTPEKKGRWESSALSTLNIWCVLLLHCLKDLYCFNKGQLISWQVPFSWAIVYQH